MVLHAYKSSVISLRHSLHASCRTRHERRAPLLCGRSLYTTLRSYHRGAQLASFAPLYTCRTAPRRRHTTQARGSRTHSLFSWHAAHLFSLCDVRYLAVALTLVLTLVVVDKRNIVICCAPQIVIISRYAACVMFIVLAIAVTRSGSMAK